MAYGNSVSLLEEDPDLGSGLGFEAFAAAHRELTFSVVERDRGPLEDWPGLESVDHALGLLILDGLVTRRVSVAGRRCLELLGAGDLLRPWQNDGRHGVAPFESSHEAITGVRLAVLDARAAARIGRWPEVMTALVSRVMNRSRAMAGHLALAQMPRVDDRLLVLLWHLADRWGRVTPKGVSLALPLSHEMLGALIGAQRPTVTLALRQLVDRGKIERRPDRSWLLLEKPSFEPLGVPEAGAVTELDGRRGA